VRVCIMGAMMLGVRRASRAEPVDEGLALA
jgi:hypothetical protein